MLKLLKDQAGIDVGLSKFGDGENCLHLAVKANQADMVRHLIADFPHLAKEQTDTLLETPHFYVLSKLKDLS